MHRMTTDVNDNSSSIEMMRRGVLSMTHVMTLAAPMTVSSCRTGTELTPPDIGPKSPL
jgi:hypothetical protein